MGGSSSNTYTGPTLVNTGTLQLNKTAAARAIPGALTIGDGLGGNDADIVRLLGPNEINFSENTLLTLKSTGKLDLNGNDQILGDINMDSATIVTGSGTLGLAGDLSVVGSISTISGHVFFYQFERVVGVYDDGANLLVPASFSGHTILHKAGPGSMTLSGDNSLYEGQFFVDGGFLKVNSSTAMGAVGTAYVQVFQGARLEVLAGLTINAQVNLYGSGSSNEASLHLSGGAATWAGKVFLMTNATIRTDGDLTISGTVGGNTISKLTKTGAQDLILTASNNYHGFTLVSEGILKITHSNALGTSLSTIDTTVAAGATLEIAGGISIAEPIVLNGTGVSNGGALRSSGNNAITDIVTLASNSTVNVSQNGLELSGGVTGPGDLTKAGKGSLLLSTSSITYTGDTLVNAGTLIVMVPLPSAVTVSGGELVGGGPIDPKTPAVTSLNAVSGTVNPGGSSITGESLFGGVLQVVGDVDLHSSKFHVDFVDSIPNFDQLSVSGNSILNLGSAELDLQIGLGFVSNVDQIYAIVTNHNSDPIGGFFTRSDGTIIQQDDVIEVENPNSPGSKLKFRMSYVGGNGNDVTLTHVNTGTMAQNLQLEPRLLDEGGGVSLTGNLVDPDSLDTLTLIVDWKDGTVDEYADAGRDPFNVSHQYADNGKYFPKVSWQDDHGQGNSKIMRQVTVNNVPPAVYTGEDITLVLGHLLDRPGFFTDSGADAWRATVDYGDGTSGTLALQPDGTFHLAHTYQQVGDFLVTVAVADSDDAFGTGTFTVHLVASSAPDGRGPTKETARVLITANANANAPLADRPAVRETIAPAAVSKHLQSTTPMIATLDKGTSAVTIAVANPRYAAKLPPLFAFELDLDNPLA